MLPPDIGESVTFACLEEREITPAPGTTRLYTVQCQVDLPSKSRTTHSMEPGPDFPHGDAWMIEGPAAPLEGSNIVEIDLYVHEPILLRSTDRVFALRPMTQQEDDILAAVRRSDWCSAMGRQRLQRCLHDSNPSTPEGQRRPGGIPLPKSAGQTPSGGRGTGRVLQNQRGEGPPSSFVPGTGGWDCSRSSETTARGEIPEPARPCLRRAC